MEKTIRFGMSMEAELLNKFERQMKKKGYTNRSEAIRDLIRDSLVRDEWEGGEAESIGTVTIIYDHEERELSKKLTHNQHRNISHVVAATHVHVDSHHCLEALILRGKGREIKALADGLIGTKGVKHGQISFTTLNAIS
jgi:CopG family transcriptional regulator, nickel-responsive regulator